MPLELQARFRLTCHTVFDTYGNERLTKWKEFRDSLETSSAPFKEVATFWSRAPFVNPYLNPHLPSSWPDPWHIVLDNRYDDLAISLGMLYTIKLTHRFADLDFDLHMVDKNNKDINYFIVFGKSTVLNFEYGSVCDLNAVNVKSNIIYSGTKLP